jgi:hypothetical protein
VKLSDYICQASGWTPVTREDENRPARDITPGSVVDVIVVDPYDDEFRILEKQTVLSVRPTASASVTVLFCRWARKWSIT